MTRRYSASETARRAKAKREAALARPEIMLSTEGRQSAAGPVSFPVKVDDPENRRLIEEALARRRKP